MIDNLPISGSPILPVDIILLFIAGFIAVLFSVYAISKNRLLAIKAGLAILVFGFVSTAAFAYYWLIPTPEVIQTSATIEQGQIAPDQKIEIVFNRPVKRQLMEKSIEPATPGIWVFENPTYRTHLTRKLVFYPTQTFTPAVEYRIKLENISSAAQTSSPYSAAFVFRAADSPTVSKISPPNESRGVDPDINIAIELSQPSDVSNFDSANKYN